MFGFLSRFRKKSLAVQEKTERHHVMHWSEDEIPKYPPFMKGLPVVEPDRLIDSQRDLIDRIVNSAIATREVIDLRYIGSIRRLAAFVHLLPASQSHHHRGAGGLFRHCLEVGLWAMQSAEKVLLQSAQNPAHRREMEPRWQLAVFLAGLCHDAGKPVSDITVTNKDRTTVWDPIVEDLHTWATTNGVDAYFLDWREGRSRQHTVLSNLIGDRIIGIDTLAWINKSNTELIIWLMESLNYNPSPNNIIHDIVVKADQISVERDLKTFGVAMAGYDIGVPIERHLTDIMRRFIKEGVWRVNEAGARIWNIDGNIYLIWPSAGEELAKQVSIDGVPGIPRTPDGILDMLVERRLAFVREDAAAGERLWKIAPALLAEKIPDIKLSAIRLKDDAMLSSSPIASVEGRILAGGKKDQSINHQSHEVKAGPQQDLFTPLTENVASPNSLTTQINNADESPPPYIQSAENSLNTETSVDSVSSQPVVPQEAIEKQVVQAPTPKAEALPSKVEAKIVFDGAAGVALTALAQDLKSGDKKWGADVVLDTEKHILLAWPAAFAGYGLTGKNILDELNNREWLWIDPMSPLKKVLDADFGGQPVKAIRLMKSVSQSFLKLAGGGKAATKQDLVKVEESEQLEQTISASPVHIEKQQDDVEVVKVEVIAVEPSKPVVEKIERTKKTKKRKEKRASSEPSIADNNDLFEINPTTPEQPEDVTAPSVLKAELSGNVPSLPEKTINAVADADAVASKAKPSPLKSKKEIISEDRKNNITLDEIIAALADLPVEANANGYCVAKKSDVFNVLKKQGIPIMISELDKFGEVDPNRFLVEGKIIRYLPLA